MSTNPYISFSGPLSSSLYFSTVMSTALYGSTCMQTFIYYVHYQGDPLRFRIFVAVICALNTIHEGLIVAGAYKYIAASLANPSSALNYPPELNLQGVATSLVAVLCQGFLTYRIYIFSGRKIFTLLLWFILSLVQLVPCATYVAKAVYSADGSLQDVGIIVLHDSVFKSILALGLAAAALQDILIATFLIFLLVRERTDTVFASTTQMVQRLMAFAVNTGAWTAMFALLSLIFLYVLASKSLYIVFLFSICPLYCNTVLANLNARSYLTDGAGSKHASVELLVGAMSFPDRQSKLVFSSREVAQKTAESMTPPDADMFTIPKDSRG